MSLSSFSPSLLRGAQASPSASQLLYHYSLSISSLLYSTLYSTQLNRNVNTTSHLKLVPSRSDMMHKSPCPPKYGRERVHLAGILQLQFNWAVVLSALEVHNEDAWGSWGLYNLCRVLTVYSVTSLIFLYSLQYFTGKYSLIFCDCRNWYVNCRKTCPFSLFLF